MQQRSDEEIKAIKQEEAQRIFDEFILAGSALTMFQTEPSILWAAEELRKDMVRICGIEIMQESGEV